MTKEEILKAYLEDDLFLENGYLKEGEALNYKWSSFNESNLIQIIKMAIDGELSCESQNVTERKINTLLNK